MSSDAVVANTASTEAPQVSFTEYLNAAVEHVASQANQMKELHANLKRLLREHEREQKRVQKELSSRERKSTKRPHVVVQRPVQVTPAMASFLKAQNVPAEADGGFTRNVMMKAVSDYIRTHNLQLTENRKEWKPDTTLAKLFGLENDTVCNFMNVNGFLSRVVVKTA